MEFLTLQFPTDHLEGDGKSAATEAGVAEVDLP